MSNAAARIVCIESTAGIKPRHPETWRERKNEAVFINLDQLSGVKINTVFKHVAPRSADIDQCCRGLHEGQLSLAEGTCRVWSCKLKESGVPQTAPCQTPGTLDVSHCLRPCSAPNAFFYQSALYLRIRFHEV